MINTFGIVFSYQQKHFKLVDIEWGKDNSFYFIPRQHDAEVGRRIVTEHDDDGHLLLNIDEIETDCFPTRKISRHTSGCFHIKDVVGQGGNREQDGLKGPSFKEIRTFYTILVICPQKIDTLFQVDTPESTDVVAHLPDTIEPFTVQFAVWDKRTSLQCPAPPQSLLGNRAITLQIDGFDYGAIIALQFVSKSSPEVVNRFPARTCYIVR